MEMVFCKSGLDLSSTVPQCSGGWVSVEANLIVTPAEQLPVNPENLVLALGSGILVVLPLALLLFGVKAAKQAINKS